MKFRPYVFTKINQMQIKSTSIISSVAYGTTITDQRVFTHIQKKNKRSLEKRLHINKKDIKYVKSQLKNTDHKIGNEIDANSIGGRELQQRSPSTSSEITTIWQNNKKIVDSSRQYSSPREHLGLRTRISRNSSGSLPKPLVNATRTEIQAADRNAISSYTTNSRSIRKCCFTVFVASARLAAGYLGFTKNSKNSAYSCQSTTLSVELLGKNTNAGMDTMGRKNDPLVQKRVISQLESILKHPTSNKFFSRVNMFISDSLYNMYSLPEVIFHRFQATYNEEDDICRVKSRIVWCVPYVIVALENYFLANLIKSIQEFSILSNICYYPTGLTNFLIGQRSVGTLREQFRIIDNKEFKIYSLDFKKFDSTIPNWAKDIFFAIVGSLIFMDRNQKLAFNYLRIYVKYSPFVFDNKIMYKQKGISSGLLITNIFDTWWNLTIHFFLRILMEFYPEQSEDILAERFTFDKMYFDTKYIKDDFLMSPPLVRVMGDDSIFLCDERTLNLFICLCKNLGMSVSVKHVCHNPDDDIFFLGRYWRKDNRPFQTEAYMALRITYTKWYDKKDIPFDIKDLHLNRMLSICLPLVGGKEFLDKYLFDYEPYKRFKESKEGFIFIRDYMEDQFRFIDYAKAYDVDYY
jgi:hypothetical protein